VEDTWTDKKMLVADFCNCQHTEKEICNVASFHQKNTKLSCKNNSVSSNFQASVDGPLYKEMPQKDDIKMDLKETDEAV
jgi:hypothetical protein